MHTKISKSIDQLRTLTERAVKGGKRGAKQAFKRARSERGVQLMLHWTAELTAAVRAKIEQSGVTMRQAAFGLLALAVLLGGLTAGLVALNDPGQTPVVTAADAAGRQEAVDRADRAVRTAPTPAPATSAPAAPPAKAQQKAPAPKPAAPAKKAAPKPAPAWVNPMPGAPLSSCFGPRWGSQHKGLDFAGRNGTKILSVGKGTVVAAGWNYTGYGMSVVVDHGKGYLSHYAHAQKVLVRPGWKVKPGQPLALEGSTGDSTGPHLHFEIHKGMWNQIEPADWLRKRGVKIGC
jgi:murein DD-endopeptidase MepM/ murein hydrolase activator NlpD